MKPDPIVQEIREIRRETEEACGQDWGRLIAHYLEVQRESGRPVYRGVPKRLTEPKKG